MCSSIGGILTDIKLSLLKADTIEDMVWFPYWYSNKIYIRYFQNACMDVTIWLKKKKLFNLKVPSAIF